MRGFKRKKGFRLCGWLYGDAKRNACGVKKGCESDDALPCGECAEGVSSVKELGTRSGWRHSDVGRGAIGDWWTFMSDADNGTGVKCRNRGKQSES